MWAWPPKSRARWRMPSRPKPPPAACSGSKLSSRNGRAAKTELAKLIKGGDVSCIEKATDKYGRNIAQCSAKGVPDVGEAMVRDGYAIDLGGPAGNPYRDAEDEARSAKRGIWRGPSERPSDWRQANPRLGD